MLDLNSKDGVMSGTYRIVVDDSDKPNIYVKFSGFSTPEEASEFIHWLETVLSDPLGKVIH
jgi:hypothetical protein